MTAALRVVTRLAGGVVTHTTDGVHSDGSLHYPAQGARAVDVALPSGPSYDSPELGDVMARIVELIPLPFIAELIWAGPNPIFVKNGRRVAPYAAAAHRNHGHLAAVPGFTYAGGTMPSPSPTSTELLAAFPFEKGYVLVTKDGAVFCFGCDYKGGLRWDADQGAWVLR